MAKIDEKELDELTSELDKLIEEQKQDMESEQEYYDTGKGCKFDNPVQGTMHCDVCYKFVIPEHDMFACSEKLCPCTQCFSDEYSESVQELDFNKEF